MHRALLVSEILLGVFMHLMTVTSDQPLYEESVTYWHEFDYRKFFSTKNTLSSDHNRYLTRLSFAALARTCKTFHEPAMDFLWADTGNHGIGPLLGCVTRLHPLIYYYRHDGKQRAPNWSGVEPISEHEAHQFLRYAARVRYLSVGTEVHLHLLTVFPILEARMFPRLLALEWKPDTNTMLHLFLSPTLRRCALTDVHSDSKSIGTLCHGLESLSIWGEVTLEAYDLSLLSESVRSCKRLKHLRCPSLDSAAWKYLSNLPTLVTLAICNGPYNALLNRDNIILAPFLNVTALTFHSRSATDIITIIQHSEFPSLKEFGATVDDLPWSDSEQLFHALARCKACHTLEIIHVDVFYPATERSDGTSTAIRQLLCFPQLRALRLSIQSFIHIDNDVLLEAMPSWPHIRSLELYSQRLRVFQPEGPPPTVTFRGLFAVLRLCPNLQALWLDIDAVNIDIDPENESFQHTSLQELDVCSSIAEDPERVTRIISTMLPRISTVIYNPTPFTSRGVWDEVNTRLRKN